MFPFRSGFIESKYGQGLGKYEDVLRRTLTSTMKKGEQVIDTNERGIIKHPRGEDKV